MNNIWKSSIFSIYLLKVEKMHRKKMENNASNYCSFYGLKDEKCLEELQQLVGKHYSKEYLIFAYIIQKNKSI